jgi:hypothetical protein
MEDDKLLFDECGRCSPQINGRGSIDYHAFHFRFVESRYGEYFLLVRHGCGDERIGMGYVSTRLAELLAPMDSDARYLMLHALYDTHRDATRQAQEKEAHRWSEATVEGRVKTRKVRGQNKVKIWIEPKVTSGNILNS